MGSCGKVISKTFQIKNDDNLVYEALRYGPSYASKLTPCIQACDLIEGQWGNIGSLICWTFQQDGRRGTMKEVITSIDEKKKLIGVKVIEGEVMNAYKSFLITFQSSNNSASYTIEYEKLNQNIPNPTSFLELLVKATQDIDRNHQMIPRLCPNN